MSQCVAAKLVAARQSITWITKTKKNLTIDIITIDIIVTAERLQNNHV